MPEKLIKRETVYQGRVIRLELDEVVMPDGTQARQEMVRHPGGVVILPLRATDNPKDPEVILIRQYRHVIQKWILELPAGKLEWKDGHPENPAMAAQRELVEEIRMDAKHWTFLGEFVTVPGFCDEVLYGYEATGLYEDDTFEADANEEIELVPVRLSELREWIRDGKIQDAKTLAMLLLWQEHDRVRTTLPELAP